VPRAAREFIQYVVIHRRRRRAELGYVSNQVRIPEYVFQIAAADS
jgi:hypothetical protein